MMLEFKPESVTEAMLCTQMVGVHHAALYHLSQASHGGERSESYLLRATKLMQLFHEQAEAMAKLKGKTGQQTVRVEHVHVHGGQAIVGAVDSAALNQGEGGNEKTRKNTR